MKILSKLAIVSLLFAGGAISASSQTVIQTVRVELTYLPVTPGFASGDQFDLSFALNFDAQDMQADLANFQNSAAGIVAPESIHLTRVAGNTGTWDPGALTFTASHLLASNTATYDTLGFTFESNTPNVPAPGYTFMWITLNFWTYTNLGVIQGAPATNSPLSTFLGGPAVDYAAFELAYGTFDFGTDGAGFNVVATAIPEPSTYVAFAGIGALGLALWRRTQVKRQAI